MLLWIFFLAMTIASFLILTSSPHLYYFIDMISQHVNGSEDEKGAEYDILTTFDDYGTD